MKSGIIAAEQVAQAIKAGTAEETTGLWNYTEAIKAYKQALKIDEENLQILHINYALRAKLKCEEYIWCENSNKRKFTNLTFSTMPLEQS